MQQQDPLKSTQPANLGGKMVKKTELYNHHKALTTIQKKTESNADKKHGPHPHVDAVYREKPKAPLRYKYLDEFGFVYKTYKACDSKNMEKRNNKVDCKEPNT